MKIRLALLLTLIQGVTTDAEPACLFSIDAAELAKISVAPRPSESLTKPYFNTQLRQSFNIIERPANKEDHEKAKFTVPDAPPPPPAMSPNVAFEKALDAVHGHGIVVSEEIIKELKVLLQHSMFATHASDVAFLTALIEETVALSEGTKEAAANDILMVTKGGKVKIPFKVHHMKGNPLGTAFFQGTPLDGSMSVEVKVPKWSPVDVGREGGLSLAPAPSIASPIKLRAIKHEVETENTILYQLMQFKMTSRQPLSFPIEDLNVIDDDKELWWFDDPLQIHSDLEAKEPRIIPYRTHQKEIVPPEEAELELLDQHLDELIKEFLRIVEQEEEEVFEDAKYTFEEAATIEDDTELKVPEQPVSDERSPEAVVDQEDTQPAVKKVKNKKKKQKKGEKDKAEAEALKQKAKVEAAIKLKQTIEMEIASLERDLQKLQKKFDKGKTGLKNFKQQKNPISSRLRHLQNWLAEVTATIPFSHQEVVAEVPTNTKKKQKKKRNKKQPVPTIETIEPEFLDANQEFDTEHLPGDELQQEVPAVEEMSSPGLAQQLMGKASEVGQTIYRMGSEAIERAGRVASNMVGNKRSASTPPGSSRKAKTSSHSSNAGDNDRESSEGSWEGLKHLFSGFV